MQLVALGGIVKMPRTSSPCHFWRFPSFARGQYLRTAPARKIRNLSHFLEVSPVLIDNILGNIYEYFNLPCLR